MKGDTRGTMRKLHEEHSWYKTDSDKTEFRIKMLEVTCQMKDIDKTEI